MRLYLACALTMAIEAGYFLLRGYRRRDFAVLCLAANAATNLSLNLLLGALPRSIWLVLGLELAVVAGEYAAYRLLLGPKKLLLADTAAANLLSACAGSLLLRLLLP